MVRNECASVVAFKVVVWVACYAAGCNTPRKVHMVVPKLMGKIAARAVWSFKIMVWRLGAIDEVIVGT